MKIKQVSNGYIVSFVCTCDDDETEFVISNECGSWEDIELLDDLDKRAGYKLLHFIMEHYLLGGSKHDTARIRINIETVKGDEKHEKQ